MDSVLSNVTSAAVWGSLSASVLLGTFMLVQAVLDKDRRFSLLALSGVSFLIASIDFLHGSLSAAQYEQLRVFAWTAYALSILVIFGYSIKALLLAGLLLGGGGVLVWQIDSDLATSYVIPASFFLAAALHGAQYWKSRGYASCVLCTYSVLLGLMCSLYYPVMATGSVEVITLGYGHYAFTFAFAVAFGWIYLPRELRGKTPVSTSPNLALGYFALMILAEAGVQASLLLFHSWPPYLYLAVSLLQASATLGLFFFHRHQLVIFTDNVSSLLEERTRSLEEARLELSRQNELQAERLAEQARELNSRAEVIDRQRRLELAAQTAGQAAHDIQNIISPIYSDLDKITESTKNSPEVNQRASSIKHQLDELKELNGQLLSLSRRGRVEKYAFRIDELLGRITERFSVVCEGFPRPVWIEGSWSQLSRAVTNLVVNAVEAAGESGTVKVRHGIREITELTRCHLGFLKPAKYAFIEVEDNGPGVPEGILEQIFEPFFSSKSTAGESGSGLGLTIVAAVTDDHNGVLDIATGSDGTKFTIYLKTIEAPGHTEQMPFGSLSGNETVIVIDDDINIQNEHVSLLSKSGYETVGASSGLEALKIIQSENVDLMLLDMNLPDKNGLDVFFAALHIRPGVRAIVYTSHITPQEESRLKQLGVTDIILKPASPARFLSAIRQALDQRQ